MMRLNDYRMNLVLVGCVVALFALNPVNIQAQDGRPIADAGSSRYAGPDPIVLDGTGSYDPDNSGLLSYSWQQISGPSVIISDANTATATISGFAQTDEIQECEFELVVSDGELISQPDAVKVIIVPDFGTSLLIDRSYPAFSPYKPTVVQFAGTGGCQNCGPWYFSLPWDERVNQLAFNDFQADIHNIKRLRDMLIVYLSHQAPDYKQPIQTVGGSAGGEPAIDIAIYLNETYQDPRYAVNRVTFLDATPYCLDYTESVSRFIVSRVDGEQCWIDSYISTVGWGWETRFQANVLNVEFDISDHGLAGAWYDKSLAGEDMNVFNNGVIAGAYWSVVGPGRNLQLASTPGKQTYRFKWHGDASSGYMDFHYEPNHPGRLPEPVTLLAYSDALDPNDEPTGALLTCKESENAVGYQLLFGPDPYRVMDYNIISDTPTPPTEIITTFPFEETWWTIRARDQYGSTIYADPIRVNLENLLTMPPIDNLTNGRRYGYIQLAINDVNPGDEIVVGPGIYQGDISFRGKNLTLRSTEPNDSAIVATTIIEGYGSNSVVTFSDGEDANCELTGFIITGGNVENGGGIYCGDNSTPTITNCIITNNSANQAGGGMYTDNSSPTVLNCIFKENSANLGAGVYTGSGNTTLINCTLADNAGFWAGGICNFEGSPVLTNCILWDNTDPEIGGMAMATYSDIRGGWPGEGNIDADPLFADLDNGDYHLKSQAGRWNPNSQNWVQDDVTSPCIDVGDPISPVGLELLPNGGVINMGAHGGTLEASKSQ